METNTFTIFTKYESGYEGHLSALEGSLDECILQTAGFWLPKEGGFATPTAWTAGCSGGNAARAKAIAAGRTIELADGKFVARGVEDSESPATVDDLVKRITPENCHADAWEPKPAQTLGDLPRKAGDRLPSKTPTLDKLEAEHAGNARMIARDGFTKSARIAWIVSSAPPAPVIACALVSTAKPALSFLTYSPDLQPSSHQVGPKFGSALLRG